jgi:hypothetical protein
MDSDFIDRYAGAHADRRAGIRAAYDEVVEDLIAELRKVQAYPDFPEQRSIHAVAEAAIRYARELTRNIDPRMLAARKTRAFDRLQDELRDWHDGCVRRAAEREAKRIAEYEARERAKKEERRRRREAKKAKLAVEPASAPSNRCSDL